MTQQSLDDYMAVPDVDGRDIIKLNTLLMECFGYLAPESATTWDKVRHKFYTFVCVGCALGLFTLSQFTNMLVVFGDIEKMTDASFLLLTHLVEMAKLYVTFAYTERVRRLINSLNRPEFKPKNWQQYATFQNNVKMSRGITLTFLGMCVLTCALWAVFPLLDEGTDHTLPLSGWFPFDTEPSPTFEIVYVYQSIAALINGLGNISMDTFMSGVIMAISCQLSLLNNSFQNMMVEYKLGVKNEQRAELKMILMQNINHHRYIMEFAAEFTNLFTKCIMGQFVVSVIIICITMFQMTLVSVVSLQFLSMVIYQACMLLEVFLLCYYGNEIILKVSVAQEVINNSDQSAHLTESAYMCQWMDCSDEFKRNLLFFMTRSQVPLKLYAGGYFTLSLDTFMAILKSSWSYFAVLNRVHSED